MHNITVPPLNYNYISQLFRWIRAEYIRIMPNGFCAILSVLYTVNQKRRDCDSDDGKYNPFQWNISERETQNRKIRKKIGK